MKTPSWDEVEQFCNRDGWAEKRRSDHVHYEKTLADGTCLRTHRSFSGKKSMSPGRFKAILRDQLKVSERDFWRVLETGTPADRPSVLPEEPPSHPLWVVRVLKNQLQLSEKEIGALSPEEAEQRVHHHWSRRSDN